MSRSDGRGGEGELAAAVAAAALAVDRIEGSAIPNRNPASAGPESTLTKAKSKRQSVSTKLETGEESIKSLDREIPITGTTQPVQKRPTLAEKLLESTEDAKEGAPTPPKPSPSVKRASSSADKQFKKVTSIKPEISSSKPLPTIKSTAPPPPKFKTRQSSAIPGSESKADAWLRQELSRIKNSHDNLNAVIASWETQKKKKARRKLAATESELQRKREQASKTYQTRMQRIELIVAAARAQAQERQRREGLMARDKADRLGTTGKLPTTCFSF